ncbi:MAG: hypothetical protein JWL96_4065, partial [Sphingomonas bacterium]|nr:hypothetical protein [Sphingomonas bacterium]
YLSPEEYEESMPRSWRGLTPTMIAAN